MHLGAQQHNLREATTVAAGSAGLVPAGPQGQAQEDGPWPTLSAGSSPIRAKTTTSSERTSPTLSWETHTRRAILGVAPRSAGRCPRAGAATITLRAAG